MVATADSTTDTNDMVHATYYGATQSAGGRTRVGSILDGEVSLHGASAAPHMGRGLGARAATSLNLETSKPPSSARVSTAPPAKRAPAAVGTHKRPRKTVVRADSSDGESDQDAVPVPKSRFAGVHWNRRKHKWRVRIKAHGRDTHVGYFVSEHEAAAAYDRCLPGPARGAARPRAPAHPRTLQPQFPPAHSDRARARLTPRGRARLAPRARGQLSRLCLFVRAGR